MVVLNPNESKSLSPTRARLALLALAMGGFAIGSGEFVAMGLLPNLASDLMPDLYALSHEQANAQAGWLISAYALGVIVGAPTIAAAGARLPRKKLLLWLLAAFVICTSGSAVLPSFDLVVLSRFVGALPHGAYFGIASLVAASLMEPGKRARGVAVVLSGLTIANVVGVPLITWMGQLNGWRIAYLIVVGIFGLTFLAVAAFVPQQPGDDQATLGKELRAFGRIQVWLTLLIGAIGFGGLFAVYTYVAPLVTDVTRLSSAMVPWVLVVVGLGMTVGNFVGGHHADVNVKRSFYVFFGVLLFGLAGLTLTAHAVAGLFFFLFVIGGATSALAPTIQLRLMDVARDSQAIAAALNHSALNAGNSLGALLGGVVIAAGLGYVAPTCVGFLLSAAGLALVVVSYRIERNSYSTPKMMPS